MQQISAKIVQYNTWLGGGDSPLGTEQENEIWSYILMEFLVMTDIFLI